MQFFIALIITLVMNALPLQATSLPRIIITEIGAHETSDKEWIEIYNTTEETISLEDWKFFENNTNHGLTALTSYELPAHTYAIIADVADIFLETRPDFIGIVFDSSWTTLNLSGEYLALIDPQQQIVFEITYPAVEKTSLQYDMSDETWKSHPTSDSAGFENEFAESLPPEGDDTLDESTTASTSTSSGGELTDNEQPLVISQGALIINEFVADPVSGEKEWIELYNTTSHELPLTGFVLTENSKAQNKLTGSIAPGGYFVHYFSSAKLNNGGDVIQLYYNNLLFDEITYGSADIPAPDEGISLARFEDGTWHLSKTPTPGLSNIITKEIVLGNDSKTSTTIPQAKGSVIFNEIFPNPIGSDQLYEFIELKNISSESVNLKGWTIKDADANYFTFTNYYLQPQQLVVLERAQTFLPLENDKETLHLLNEKGDVIDVVSYRFPIKEDESLQKITGEWKLTSAPTKGEENRYYPINVPPKISVTCPKDINKGTPFVCDASDSYDPNQTPIMFTWKLQTHDGIIGNVYTSDVPTITITDDYYTTLVLEVSDGTLTTTQKISLSLAGLAHPIQLDHTNSLSSIQVQKTQKQPLQTSDAVEGVVTVLPGTFGVNYFFIDNHAMQIHGNNDLFPSLEIGDRIRVQGKRGVTAGNPKMTITSASDISIVKSNEIITPFEITLSDTLDDHLNTLVTVDGSLSKIGGAHYLLTAPDGAITVTIKQKTKISTKDIRETKYSIIGILQKTTDGYALLPRSYDDLTLLTDDTPPVAGRVESKKHETPPPETSVIEVAPLPSSNTSASVVPVLTTVLLIITTIIGVAWKLHTLHPPSLKSGSDLRATRKEDGIANELLFTK